MMGIEEGNLAMRKSPKGNMNCDMGKENRECEDGEGRGI
jgi:hypothetical protein